MSRVVIAVTCAALVLSASPGPGPAPPVRAVPAARRPAVAYTAPVGAPVVVARPFVAPAGPYAAGHRGVDLTTASGGLVRAAGPGLVRFAGPLAGRGVVVIEHPDGVLTEYEPLAASVPAGTRVARGQPIGRVLGRHGTCAAARCLHWSARRNGEYFDPMTLLLALGPVRLLPWAEPPRPPSFARACADAPVPDRVSAQDR
jgi:murein DD-endopeptidase MepM/ murein hydrolase activator NlpD